MRGGVSDWDAIMGEAALGLDLARVDSLLNGLLAVPDTVPDDLETKPEPASPPGRCWPSASSWVVPASAGSARC